MIDVKNGKRDHVNWKGPLILLMVITAVSLALNVYLFSTYNLAFFLNSFSSIIGLIAVGALWAVIAVINIISTIIARRKNLPKTLHNPKAIWLFSGVLAGVMLFFFLWFVPIGQKIAYAVTLNDAVNAMEDTPKNEDISLVLVRSEDSCLNIRNCDKKYNNVFYVRSNLDGTKEVQVKIRAANKNQEELKVIDSEIMKLDSGEMKMVETEETSDSKDVWGKYSFTTEKRVFYYQYNYRYRDPS
ncbi:hypothetical protein [Lentibacillus juripiscarius]|uniref:Uncharacterized protein n=1 Tax=Lentibacillus juripiscarius TaxID=257446 RepID=A0ABW5V3V0_9BACI